MKEQIHASGAGKWFPASEAALRAQIERCIQDAEVPQLSGRLVGAIAPHAGYDFSGAIAGHTFRALADQKAKGPGPETVVILGFPHRFTFPGVALIDARTFNTSLGPTPIDMDGAHLLVDAGNTDIHFANEAHVGEHSAENEIPFTQVATPDAALIVALIGDHEASTRQSLSQALTTLAVEREIVVIASTDLLHDPDFDHVTRSDEQTLATMAGMQDNDLTAKWDPRNQICCGISGVTALIQFCRNMGSRSGTILAYTNSGIAHPESRGDWVVGYGSIAYTA